jgi:hypothetical protein
MTIKERKAYKKWATDSYKAAIAFEFPKAVMAKLGDKLFLERTAARRFVGTVDKLAFELNGIATCDRGCITNVEIIANDGGCCEMRFTKLRDGVVSVAGVTMERVVRVFVAETGLRVF